MSASMLEPIMHMKSTGTVLAHSRVPATRDATRCRMLTRCPYRCMMIWRWRCVRGARCGMLRWGLTSAEVQPSVLRERHEHCGQHLQDNHTQRRAGLFDRPLVEQRHPYGAHAPRCSRRERLAARAEEGDGAAQQNRDQAHALLALLGHRQQLSEPAEHAKLPAAVAHRESSQTRVVGEVRNRRLS